MRTFVLETPTPKLVTFEEIAVGEFITLNERKNRLCMKTADDEAVVVASDAGDVGETFPVWVASRSYLIIDIPELRGRVR